MHLATPLTRPRATIISMETDISIALHFRMLYITMLFLTHKTAIGLKL